MGVCRLMPSDPKELREESASCEPPSARPNVDGLASFPAGVVAVAGAVPAGGVAAELARLSADGLPTRLGLSPPPPPDSASPSDDAIPPSSGFDVWPGSETPATAPPNPVN